MTTDHSSETLISLFVRRVEQDGSRTSIWVPAGEGSYAGISWDELATDVRRMAVMLRRVGVAPGDRVVQAAENRYEWIVSDLAILMARAIHVSVHSALSGPQIAWQIIDSGASVVLVSGSEQAEKLTASNVQLPESISIYSYDQCAVQIGCREIGQLSRAILDVSEGEMKAIEAEALASLKADDVATILYTSGTTGEPKGVMLTHGNLVFDAEGTVAAYNSTAEDLRLCWLPLSHIFARTCDMYTWITRGSQLALAESRDTILTNCAELSPTVMNGVPYFFDKVMRRVIQDGHADTPGKLQELLGGRLRMCCSGGAALSDTTAEFFARQGVLLVQGYGLTETSPVITASSRQHNKLGYVGRPIAGVEVKIAPDGEILTRGPHVMHGYWNKPHETEQAFEGGWLKTGDLGEVDAEGYLRVTGRKKELIVTAAGKNVAPAYLERLLSEHPLIVQALVLGDGRNYLSALIVPNPDALRAAIIQASIPVRSREEALVHPQVHALYRAAIDQQLAGLGHYEQVGRFTLLDRGFTVESGELTPTLKLRRQVIAANFQRVIEAMYEPSASSAVPVAVS